MDALIGHTDFQMFQDSTIIKRDITLTRKKLESDYETKLQEKSFDL